MMPLFAMTPYRDDRNLGRAYNDAVERLHDDDWCCLLDHDVHLLTLDWWRQLQEAIACRPDAGVFTCMTNRIAAPWQQFGPKECHDIGALQKIALERQRVRTLLDITETKGFGGCLMCFSKRAWRAVGGFVDGMFCVDHNFLFALRRANYRAYLIEGLYIYHRRRAFGHGMNEIGRDAPIKARCECRGVERLPHVRISLDEVAA